MLTRLLRQEWAGSKGFGMVTGWSAVGGQSQSPYVRGGYVETRFWDTALRAAHHLDRLWLWPLDSHQ